MILDQAYDLVPVGQLHPHPANPRRGDVDRIAESVSVNSFYGALIVQRSTGHVLAGNHRLLAAKQQGLEAVPVLWVDVDDEAATRILLADNRTNDVATYDEQELVALLRDLDLTDGGLAGTGYSADDLAALVGEPEELPPALNDPDDVPDPPKAPTSVLGDVWLLGPHRVLCGDSTDVAAVEAMLAGDRADCMWTDPPYGVEYVGKTKDALMIQNDGAGGLPELLAGAFAVATAALKPGAPVYVAHAPGPLALDFMQAFTGAGWLWRQNLVWVKDVLVLGRSDYHYRHEPVIYGFTDGGDGRLGRGGERWYGDNAQTTVFEVPKPSRSEAHPTMKPVELIARMLSNSCPPGGLVYEAFGGSGSTLIAAHLLGLAARVVELDPRYVDVICRRYQEHTGTKPVLQATGEPHDFAS